MTRKKLNKIWRAIGAARRTLPKLVDLEKLARMCGRTPYGGGNHVMWMSVAFPRHRAFPIPRHGGNPIASYTVRDAVLEHMDADACAWEEVLEEIEEEDEDDASEYGKGDGNGTD